MTDKEIKDLENFIIHLEKKVEELENIIEWKSKRISELESYSRELESKVYGGPTK